MRSSITWALVALTGTASAAPSSTPKADNACALAQATAKQYLLDNPNANVAFIRPSLATNCLKSVAVDKQKDVDLLNYLEPYIAFQSTLETLADPPEGYLLPGVDVIKGFGQIRAKLIQNEYENQLDFANDLLAIFYQAADGHFSYRPAILDIFRFQSNNDVVSVADEPTGLPRIYLETDLIKDLENDTDVYDIDSIDGIPIVDFLEAHTFFLQKQDPDAKYNTLFRNPAIFAKNGVGAFKIRSNGSPDQEVIKFTNGTTFTNKLWAIVQAGKIDYIGSPESIHENYELPATATPTTVAPTTAPTASTTVAVVKPTPTPSPTQLAGYPKPVAFHEHQWISGYFLDGDYKDTAVLVVPSFNAWSVPTVQKNGTFEIEEAGRATAEFLKKAKAAGKKKLIIDVQNNGGGLIFAGFQLYLQLFPNDINLWAGNRLRAHEALNVLMLTAEKSAPQEYDDFIGTFNDGKGKEYKSWSDLYGPQSIGGGNVTNLLNYDLENDFPWRAIQDEQIFAAEDIVIVTNGDCGSTCTIFTGLMHREQGVRTIALGGRPLEAAMQAIGGVEGSQVYEFAQLRRYMYGIAKGAIKDNNMKLLTENFAIIPDFGEPPLLPPLATAGGFNWRNAYARKNANGYPEQFVYEAANCRLFYTAQMIKDPVAIWTASYDAAWKKAKCVSGSTVNTDGTISDKKIGYSPKVLSKAKPYNGPGALSYKGAYEPPTPYDQGLRELQSRSIIDQLTPPDDYEFVPQPKIGDVKEYIEQFIPDDYEFKQEEKYGATAKAVEMN